MSCKKMFIKSLCLLTAREVGGGVKALADVAILCTFFTCTSIYEYVYVLIQDRPEMDD